MKIRWIAAGPSAAHCLAGDMEGRLFSWGRNEVRSWVGGEKGGQTDGWAEHMGG